MSGVVTQEGAYREMLVAPCDGIAANAVVSYNSANGVKVIIEGPQIAPSIVSEVGDKLWKLQSPEFTQIKRKSS